MRCIHIEGIGTSDLHELILCESEDDVYLLLCSNRIVDMETFDLHGLILCVSEGEVSDLLCIDIVDMETSC